MKKPQRVITIVHTGTGNDGTTNIGTGRVSKSSLIIEYVGMLDSCQSLTYFDALYLSGYENLIIKIQNIFFLLGGLAHNPKKEEYQNQLKIYYDELKKDIVNLLDDPSMAPLSGFIRTNRINAPLMQLRSEIRKTELVAVKIAIAENQAERNFNIETLNLLSDVVFALAWKISNKFNILSAWPS
jgi:cob(I)alamin adenosyltransferase